MTTITAFAPPPNGNFQFTLQLDSQQFSAVVTWNIDGNRWYVNVSQTGGALLFSLPIIGSTDGTPIQSIEHSINTVYVDVGTPHGYKLLETVEVTVSGCTPNGYNGRFPAFITGPTTFEYPLSIDPGPALALGNQSYDINIAAGYVQTSTLVFRESSQTFEVSP